MADPHSILKKVFGYDSFRPGQEDIVRRLLDGEPLAYVLGEWEFYGLPLRVTPDVLIPRDDTCAVAELAIRKALFLEQDPRILDLCCGSGCIGLAIASRVKDAKVTLADLSMEALAIAKENTDLLEKVNKALAELTADGTLQSIVDKYIK